jgi:hypothetical protein
MLMTNFLLFDNNYVFQEKTDSSTRSTPTLQSPKQRRSREATNTRLTKNFAGEKSSFRKGKSKNRNKTKTLTKQKQMQKTKEKAKAKAKAKIKKKYL